jgi:DivIVA protein
MEVSPVSAFEPELPAEPKVDMPDFMVVLRGFDRRQVEMWAAEVANQIEQERRRADEAEKRAYRAQIESTGAPSFSHLGSHVASILEEAGRSSENMLADAAERAQETIEAAEAEAAEIIKAAEHRAGEIEGEARRILEESRAEGARVEEDALQAAEEMRAQAEQDARAVLEEARDATDMIWQEAERERLGVEAETIRLETLRHRSLEQLGRVYGHLESVLDEVRVGIGRVEEEQEDLDEATAAAAARLGVEPPASSPEESPRFPAPRDRGGDAADEQPDRAGGAGDGMLSATRPDAPTTPDAPAEDADATQPVPAAEAAETTQPTTPPGGATEITQPAPPGGADETTQPTPAEAAAEARAAETPAGEAADGAAPASGDQDATQRLEPVGNGKARSGKPAAKESKGQGQG